MAVRLLEMRRLLKRCGEPLPATAISRQAITLRCCQMHCLGARNFTKRVIAWKRQSSHNRARTWLPIHDTILYYAGPKRFTWNRILQPLDTAYSDRFYRHKDAKGCYRVVDLTGSGVRDADTGQPLRKIETADRNRHWELPPDRALPEGSVFPDALRLICQAEIVRTRSTQRT